MTTKKSIPKKTVNIQFIEVVNWKKAQPRMKDGPNDWMKLYTSLLEHEGFASLDDSARLLLIGLWLYAARSGLHILPADPKWIARKIPMLNSVPDLEPLLKVTDIYGNPTPFIAYCDPPKAKKAKKAAKPNKPASVKKPKSKKEKSRTEESREEESRVEKRREEETKPLRVSEEKKKEEKKRISPAPEETSSAQTTEAPEPEKPENPTNSEAGSAKRHILPKPTRSVIGDTGPRHIGAIINEWIPDHWQDPDAESFGWDIVEALGYSTDRNNLISRSEWGVFAKWWVKVKKSTPSIVLDEIRAEAVSKAVYLCTKGKSAKNPSKVWLHIMKGVLSKHGVRMPQEARASPY